MNESTFSLAQIWAQGDGVSHAVAIMLILMSLASWSVIFVKAWSLVQLRRMSGGAKQFWHATSFEAGMAALAPPPTTPSATWPSAAPRRSATTPHRDELHGVLGLNDWLTSTLRQSIDDTTGRLQSGLSILASVGSTAPSSACSAPCGASTTR
jgi:biopolymer transport protein ExbB